MRTLIGRRLAVGVVLLGLGGRPAAARATEPADVFRSHVELRRVDIAHQSSPDTPMLVGNAHPAAPFRVDSALGGDEGPQPWVRLLETERRVEIAPVGLLSLVNPMPLLERTAAMIPNPFRWDGRFRAEYADNFHDVTRLGAGAIIMGGLPVGIDSELNYWQQDDDRRLGDRFWSGDFNVVFRFRRIPSRYWRIDHAEFRAGAGVNWLHDFDRTEAGWNTTYGLDFDLRGPWLISTSIDYGRLGGEDLLHMRITGGLDLGRFELFTGYDFYEVGDVERKGLVLGVGMWF